MGKVAIGFLLTAVLLVPAALWYITTRHPTVEQVDNGWAFHYTLCVPTLPYGTCQKAPFTLMVPKGKEAFGMPYSKRVKSVDTVDDARAEAELRADMIENVHREAP